MKSKWRWLQGPRKWDDLLKIMFYLTLWKKLKLIPHKSTNKHPPTPPHIPAGMFHIVGLLHLKSSFVLSAVDAERDTDAVPCVTQSENKKTKTQRKWDVGCISGKVRLIFVGLHYSGNRQATVLRNLLAPRRRKFSGEKRFCYFGWMEISFSCSFSYFLFYFVGHILVWHSFSQPSLVLHHPSCHLPAVLLASSEQYFNDVSLKYCSGRHYWQQFLYFRESAQLFV